VIVDARDSRGGYLNGLQLEAAVINSQLERLSVPLQQTAPGRYEATFSPSQEGAYFVTVAGSAPAPDAAGAPGTVVQTAGWVLSYSDEYRLDAADVSEPLALLESIARTTGGRSLAD